MLAPPKLIPIAIRHPGAVVGAGMGTQDEPVSASMLERQPTKTQAGIVESLLVVEVELNEVGFN